MSDLPESPAERVADYPETPIAPADVASAGRSCSAIVVLAAVVVLVLCVALAVRWATAQ